ncbi:MAG: 2-phospho-L-lactate guanylyltransferase [Magnetovibrionaceae bacterium]
MSEPGRYAKQTCCIVPVKSQERAKSRLAPLLSSNERRMLSSAMLTDVLNRLKAVSGIDYIKVLTRDRIASDIASRMGVDLLPDGPKSDLNQALTRAAVQLEEEKMGTMVIVPADVPGLEPDELDRVLDRHNLEAGISLVPDRRGGGTNLLVASPPTALPFRFGRNSFRAHRHLAAGSNLTCNVALLPGIGLDLDLAHDLEKYLATGPDGETAALLRCWDISSRLEAIEPQGGTRP